MNNSINHKFHHISRAEYRELLAVSRMTLLPIILLIMFYSRLINGGEISFNCD